MDDKSSHNPIKRIAMSKEDALFYRIKYGEEPKFRIEKVCHDDGPNEISDNKLYLTYILTNIPKENWPHD